MDNNRRDVQPLSPRAFDHLYHFARLVPHADGAEFDVRNLYGDFGLTANANRFTESVER